jgi:hypothetical protein
MRVFGWSFHESAENFNFLFAVITQHREQCLVNNQEENDLQEDEIIAHQTNLC